MKLGIEKPPARTVGGLVDIDHKVTPIAAEEMATLGFVCGGYNALFALRTTRLLAPAKAFQQLSNIYFLHLFRPPFLHSYSGYSRLTVFIILRKS